MGNNQPSARRTPPAHSPHSSSSNKDDTGHCDGSEDDHSIASAGAAAAEQHTLGNSTRSRGATSAPAPSDTTPPTAVRTDHTVRRASAHVPPPLQLDKIHRVAATRDRNASQTSISTTTTSSRRLEDFYDVQSTQPIGRGHYAVVCRGTCRTTGRAVAIKRIKRFLSDPTRIQAEICVLQRIDHHRNIVQLFDVFATAREVQLVVELCTGGELFARLADRGPYSEADCARHVRDMARAIQCFHARGIVHRDLKPENLLLSTTIDDDAVVKVADFGCATWIQDPFEPLTTKCGTWGYSAPEIMHGSDVTFGYDAKVDAWSLGTIVYILLCGFHPFDPLGTCSASEMLANIRACRFDFADRDAWRTISDAAKDLIQHLLVLNPHARYSMDDVVSHPWLSETSLRPLAAHAPLSPTIHHDLRTFHDAKTSHLRQQHACATQDDEDDDRETTDAFVAARRACCGCKLDKRCQHETTMRESALEE